MTKTRMMSVHLLLIHVVFTAETSPNLSALEAIIRGRCLCNMVPPNTQCSYHTSETCDELWDSFRDAWVGKPEANYDSFMQLMDFSTPPDTIMFWTNTYKQAHALSYNGRYATGPPMPHPGPSRALTCPQLHNDGRHGRGSTHERTSLGGRCQCALPPDSSEELQSPHGDVLAGSVDRVCT